MPTRCPLEFCSVAEAAEVIRAKPQRNYDLLSDGRLTRHKDGARVLVSRAELVAQSERLVIQQASRAALDSKLSEEIADVWETECVK